MAMCGGMKSVEQATPEVQLLIEGARVDIEDKAGEKFEAYEAKLFSTQVVNGVNYFVKVHVGSEKYIHVRAHQAFNPDRTVTVHSVQSGKNLADELAYF